MLLWQNQYWGHLPDITRRWTKEAFEVYSITEYCFHGCFTVLKSKRKKCSCLYQGDYIEETDKKKKKNRKSFSYIKI